MGAQKSTCKDGNQEGLAPIRLEVIDDRALGRLGRPTSTSTGGSWSWRH